MQRYRKFPDFEISQYVFSQKIFCALPTLLLRPLMTITHAIFGLATSPVQQIRCQANNPSPQSRRNEKSNEKSARQKPLHQVIIKSRVLILNGILGARQIILINNLIKSIA
jgi:hypothetical protein